ncbi:hypothetical protein [uncultured Herbaspirillum sp.]|uniref:hypothetical protein n=1 Tax=uncultured Herbaspirillum sp. TaxID=160236 RepID=UPI002629596A|nr:hypothetical protein [uncultured Herbaspirillum sp.]
MNHWAYIYPDELALTLMARAGQKYRPSNGTEGELFIESWCCQCARDASSQANDDECCEIIGKTFAFSEDDPEYPAEWQYGTNGQPMCKSFVPIGMPIPPSPDVHTIDMFDGIGEPTSSSE